jgi:hypothetical protein
MDVARIDDNDLLPLVQKLSCEDLTFLKRVCIMLMGEANKSGDLGLAELWEELGLVAQREHGSREQVELQELERLFSLG